MIITQLDVFFMEEIKDLIPFHHNILFLKTYRVITDTRGGGFPAMDGGATRSTQKKCATNPHWDDLFKAAFSVYLVNMTNHDKVSILTNLPLLSLLFIDMDNSTTIIGVLGTLYSM